mmetsp:Transcript_11198/g.29536  ORF Transcript_11198/g.29536 Transcript_11198/m.29536 type:complete len:86 (+) Transcript_11198:143-400(+)
MKDESSPRKRSSLYRSFSLALLRTFIFSCMQLTSGSHTFLSLPLLEIQQRLIHAGQPSILSISARKCCAFAAGSATSRPPDVSAE